MKRFLKLKEVNVFSHVIIMGTFNGKFLWFSTKYPNKGLSDFNN